jgi:hypothetical protein
MPNDTAFGQGNTPFIPTQALWLWTTPTSGAPIPSVSGYPQGNGVYTNTKTGLQATDLQNFVGVPLYYYGNPPVPVDPSTILGWIRDAEDTVEQDTSILLCQTWVASPPTPTPESTNAVGLLVSSGSGGYQNQGIDYDLPDAAYDFMFSRAQDEGWMYLTLRYRPVQSFSYDPLNYTAIKNTAFIYPLLNTYFRMPRTWNVEDRDFGLVRYVPAANVQMLPLFAMQLAFMGFAENVPGAIWLQYTAGLTPFDYNNRFSFMKQLVLAEAATIALSSIQGTINLGTAAMTTQVDGLLQRREFDKLGAYAGLINNFQKMRDRLMDRAKNMVAGPVINMV